MSPISAEKRILWAVDALSVDEGVQIKAVPFLKLISQKGKIPVEPVYVLSPDQLKLSVSFHPGSPSEFKLAAENKLNQWMKKVKLPGLLPPTVIVSEKLSLRSAVDAFLDYAKQVDAGSLVVSTHARKGLTRILLGSFAETLVLKSNIPTLILNPKVKSPTSIKEILFPTDFSDSSHNALTQIIPMAKESKSKIILLNQLEYLTQYTAEPLVAVPVYEAYTKKDAETREKRGAEWVEMLKGKGLKSEFILSKKAKFPVETILAQSKKLKSGIIAMASHSGSVGAVLIGSIARQVVRQSKCPIWVVHPK